MKNLYYTISFFVLAILAVSCINNKKQPIEDTPIIIHDTVVVYQDATEQQLKELGLGGEVRKEKRHVQVTQSKDDQRLKRYNVIVATLSKEFGVNFLKRAFEKDGVSHFVVRNSAGLSYFVIYSSDSEQEAIKARANFLLSTAVNKTREEIWQQYFIQITDTFILEQQ